MMLMMMHEYGTTDAGVWSSFELCVATGFLLFFCVNATEWW